jgi:hypothetical protein
VAEAMVCVRRPAGNPHSEVADDSSGQVDEAVHRIGEYSDAACDDGRHHLHRYEQRDGADGDPRYALLGSLQVGDSSA